MKTITFGLVLLFCLLSIVYTSSEAEAAVQVVPEQQDQQQGDQLMGGYEKVDLKAA